MKKKKQIKKKKNVVVGIVHISTSFNNTIVNVTDIWGNVVSWASSGERSFKGSRKSTSHAAQVTAEAAATKAMEECGLKTVSVKTSGPGSGKDAAVTALISVGLTVISIKDVTPIPHNGCRPPKLRRV